MRGRAGDTRRAFLQTLHKKRYSSALEAFLFSMGSVRLLRENLERVDNTKSLKQAEEFQKAKQRFYTMVYRLKSEGLLAKDLSLTKKGLAYISFKNNKKILTYPGQYKKEIGESVILITFDIPERKRVFRDWLRKILRFLDFELLQKSVWVGKTKIPIEFLKDLKKHELTEYIEILEISKQGTIERFRKGK